MPPLVTLVLGNSLGLNAEHTDGSSTPRILEQWTVVCRSCVCCASRVRRFRREIPLVHGSAAGRFSPL